MRQALTVALQSFEGGMVAAYCFDGEGSDDGAAGSLAARLEEAQVRACAQTVDAELRKISFVSRP